MDEQREWSKVHNPDNLWRDEEPPLDDVIVGESYTEEDLDYVLALEQRVREAEELAKVRLRQWTDTQDNYFNLQELQRETHHRAEQAEARAQQLEKSVEQLNRWNDYWRHRAGVGPEEQTEIEQQIERAHKIVEEYNGQIY